MTEGRHGAIRRLALPLPEPRRPGRRPGGRPGAGARAAGRARPGQGRSARRLHRLEHPNPVRRRDRDPAGGAAADPGPPRRGPGVADPAPARPAGAARPTGAAAGGRRGDRGSAHHPGAAGSGGAGGGGHRRRAGGASAGPDRQPGQRRPGRPAAGELLGPAVDAQPLGARSGAVARLRRRPARRHRPHRPGRRRRGRAGGAGGEDRPQRGDRGPGRGRQPAAVRPRPPDPEPPRLPLGRANARDGAAAPHRPGPVAGRGGDRDAAAGGPAAARRPASDRGDDPRRRPPDRPSGAGGGVRRLPRRPRPRGLVAQAAAVAAGADPRRHGAPAGAVSRPDRLRGGPVGFRRRGRQPAGRQPGFACRLRLPDGAAGAAGRRRHAGRGRPGPRGAEGGGGRKHGADRVGIAPAVDPGDPGGLVRRRRRARGGAGGLSGPGQLPDAGDGVDRRHPDPAVPAAAAGRRPVSRRAQPARAARRGAGDGAGTDRRVDGAGRGCCCRASAGCC